MAEEIAERKEAQVSQVSQVSQPPVSGSFRVDCLPEIHALNVKKLNRVLERAGRPVLEADSVLSNDDLERLADMVAACDSEINLAAKRVLDFQQPFSINMGKAIAAAGAAGKPIPYDVLPNGVLPDREKYDLLATAAYMGKVYISTVPKTKEAMDLVDAQYMAEQLRLDAYTSFASGSKR